MSDVPALLAAAVNRLPVLPHDELSGLSPISLAHMYLSQRQAEGQILQLIMIDTLTRFSRMEFPTFIIWTVYFRFIGCS